jgi:predicted Zn-ribbon and HTH transcriptional regulator
MSHYRNEILRLLRERDPGTTICPSEVLADDEKKDKELMESVRQEARQLADEGEIEITQKGRAIDPHTIRGPIRLRLPVKK